jgi:hypothetical protein
VKKDERPYSDAEKTVDDMLEDIQDMKEMKRLGINPLVPKSLRKQKIEEAKRRPKEKPFEFRLLTPEFDARVDDPRPGDLDDMLIEGQELKKQMGRQMMDLDPRQDPGLMSKFVENIQSMPDEDLKKLYPGIAPNQARAALEAMNQTLYGDGDKREELYGPGKQFDPRDVMNLLGQASSVPNMEDMEEKVQKMMEEEVFNPVLERISPSSRMEKKKKKPETPGIGKKIAKVGAITEKALLSGRELNVMEEFKQKQEAEKAPKVREPESLDGIKPNEVLLGALLYAGIAVSFYYGGFFIFDKFNAIDVTNSAYAVQRFTGGVGNLIAATLALGLVSTSIISAGQFALFVRLVIGIQKGEIDPNKEQTIDTSAAIAKAQTSKYKKMFKYMSGDVNAGGELGARPVENKALKLLKDKLKR